MSIVYFPSLWIKNDALTFTTTNWLMADSTVATQYGLAPRGGGTLEVNRPRHLANAILVMRMRAVCVFRINLSSQH